VPAPAPVVRSLLWSVALAVVALGPVVARPADASARTYLLGDSVAAWSADVLTKQLAPAGIVLDAVACRGTVYSCVTPGQSHRPPSGLAAIQARRGRLGSTVVLELGYNDRPLAGAIDRVMRELRSQGVRRVAWVNLSERRSEYRATNQALSAARARWPELRVLDWRAVSAGHASWFIDGVHLTATGKSAFAGFLAQALRHVS
jgi:hypothetical protein